MTKYRLVQAEVSESKHPFQIQYLREGYTTINKAKWFWQEDEVIVVDDKWVIDKGYFYESLGQKYYTGLHSEEWWAIFKTYDEAKIAFDKVTDIFKVREANKMFKPIVLNTYP